MAPPASNGSTSALSRRPQDSDFYQQRLKAWQPILTPKWVIITFLLIGAAFIVIGILLKAASDRVVEYSVQYDGQGTDPALYNACHVVNGTLPKACEIEVEVTQEMKGPVYVYYELANFYQNHRRYVKSRSDQQLAGEVIADPSQLSDCDPLRGITVDGTFKTLQPCGLIANSYFNDTFAFSSTQSGLQMLETDISWPSDREKKFKAIPENVRAQYPDVIFINETYPDVPDVTDEHFIVWMRVAALPNFRKLYGRIEDTISAGTVLTFAVEANYPVSGFSGKKSLVVSTVSFLGGKNPFLGVAYIVVGGVCIVLAFAFLLRQFFGGRRLGDTSFLVWNARK